MVGIYDEAITCLLAERASRYLLTVTAYEETELESGSMAGLLLKLIMLWNLLGRLALAQMSERRYNFNESSALVECLSGGVFNVRSKLECAARCRQASEIYTVRGFA